MKPGIYCLLSFCLLACSPVRYVGIETYNPGEITFPGDVHKVLVVNNSVAQPDDVGYSLSLYGKLQDTASVSLDSVAYFTTYALGKSIVDGSYFEDVLLYDHDIRTDQQYLTDKKLTAQQVAALCRETGADAILSFDRLLFSMDKDIAGMQGGFVLGEVNVRVNSIVRTYLPGRDNPLATMPVTDSVFWQETAFTEEELGFYLPAPNEALRVAGQYIGTRIMPSFVPHWEKETRWYYVGYDTNWKEASAFAAAGNWENAERKWQAIFNSSKSWKSKARAASNIALCYEVKTDLEKAWQWADKSYQLFKQHAGEEDKFTRLEKLYAEALMDRIQADKKLKMQFGE